LNQFDQICKQKRKKGIRPGRFNIFGPFHPTFDGHVIVFAERVFGFVFFTVFFSTGQGPIPGHLGGVDPGKLRCMTALAGQPVGMIVGLGPGFVGRRGMAGFTGNLSHCGGMAIILINIC
jgi:hypothetical protein